MEKQTNKITQSLSTWCFLTIFALTILLIHGETAPVNAQSAIGSLQICVAEHEGLRNRVFHFRVGSLIIHVQTGTCSNVAEVPAGSVKVDEMIDGLMLPAGTFSGRFRLLKVTATGDGSLESVDLSQRTATVNVRAGGVENKTVVVFTHTPALTTVIEICNRTDLYAGGLFYFTIDVLPDKVITVPANGCSGLIQLNVPSHLLGIPDEADVTVTQLGVKGYRLDSVEVTSGYALDANRFNELVKGKGVRSTSDCIDERRATTNNKVLFDYALPDTCFFDNSRGGFVSADVREGGSASKTTFTFFNVNQRIGK